MNKRWYRRSVVLSLVLWAGAALGYAAAAQAGDRSPVLRKPQAVPAPADTMSAPSALRTPDAGKLYDDYSATAPHYRHLQTYVHGGYLAGAAGTPAEWDWAVAHYDRFMSAATGQVKMRNASVAVYPYAVMLTVVQDGQGFAPGLDNAYYQDMQSWFGAHPECTLERAFIHDSTGARRVRIIWGSKRWLMNPGDACVPRYAADRLLRFMQSRPQYPADGVFVDEARAAPPDYVRSIEYPGDKTAVQKDEVALMAAVHSALGSKRLIINVGDYTDPYTIRLIGAAGAAHLEYFNNPVTNMAFRWRKLGEMLATGACVNLPTPFSDPSRYAKIAGFTAGGEADAAARGRLFELASYYMALTTPDKLWLNIVNSASAPRRGWYRAYEANIGSPTAARSIYLAGTDQRGQKYEVDQRPFTRALVLARPVTSLKNADYSDASAATIPLPRSDAWYLLRMDGSISAPVTSITLRSAEAAILIRGSFLAGQ